MRIVVLALACALLGPSAVLAEPTPEQACGSSSTTMTCGGIVLKAIQQTNDVKRVLELAALWNGAYSRQVAEWKAAGRLEVAEKDSEKIEAGFKDEVNPLVKARDAAIEAALKRYLPAVAAVLGLLEAPLGGLGAFFDSSEIATDFDELNILNRQIQAKVVQKVQPYLVNDWRARYEAVATQVGPSLRVP